MARGRKPQHGRYQLRPKDDLCALMGRQHRTARERAGITLNVLAKALGKGVMTIRKHEAGAGMFEANDLFRSATIMGCDPCSLMGGNDGLCDRG